MTDEINRRRVVKYSAGAVGGIGISGLAGTASAGSCDFETDAAPFEKVNDAVELAYCESNEAVNKLQDAADEVNSDADCKILQDSESPYYVRLEEDCNWDWNITGEGCGDTRWEEHKYEDSVTKILYLSDDDTQEVVDALEYGVPFASAIAGVIVAGSLGTALPVAIVFLIVSIGIDNVTDKMEQKNEGCGVRIHMHHKKFDRGDGIDDHWQTANDWNVMIKTQ